MFHDGQTPVWFVVKWVPWEEQVEDDSLMALHVKYTFGATFWNPLNRMSFIYWWSELYMISTIEHSTFLQDFPEVLYFVERSHIGVRSAVTVMLSPSVTRQYTDT